MRSGVGALFIEEEAVNLGAESVPVMWGEPPALGEPFFSQHCRIDLPGCEVIAKKGLVFGSQRVQAGCVGKWPRVPGRNGGLVDLSKPPKEGLACADLVFL